jgi:hypothetical protein
VTLLVTKSLLWFVLIVFCFFLISLVMSRLASFLPQMNLLFPQYGHSHIAEILLFILPLGILGGSKIRAWILIVALIGLAVSFARGAMVIAAGYIIIRLFGSSRTLRRIGLVASSLLFGLALALTLVSLYPDIGGKVRLPSQISSQLFKSHPVDDRRIEYLSQAVRAIRAQPLFGAGPGTFILLSKRYQSMNNAYSFFVHNYYVQQIAEIGIVGTVLLGAIIVSIARRMMKAMSTADIYARILFDGLLLALVYGALEYSLDYAIVFVLVWVLAGTLFAQSAGDHPASSWTNGAVEIAGIFMVGFYTVGNIGLVAPCRLGIASLPRLIYVDGILRCAQEEDASRGLLYVAQNIHRADPDVWFALARQAERTGEYENATAHYQRAIELSPLFEYQRETYVRFLFKQKRFIQLADELKTRGVYGLDYRWSARLYGVGYDFFASGAYDEALVFWRTAAQASPTWSHVWIEYASLLLAMRDENGARAVLDRCSMAPHAGPHCQETARSVARNESPPPGYYRDIILGLTQ